VSHNISVQLSFISQFDIAVDLFVPLQFINPRERLAADLAGVWLHSSVYDHMCLHGTSLREGLAALLAGVWLFPAVYLNVNLEGTCLCKGLVADHTSVWLLPAVNQHMLLQVMSQGEG
jgi:hypothetical protein